MKNMERIYVSVPRELSNNNNNYKNASDRISLSKTPNLTNVQAIKGENFTDDKSLEDNLQSKMLD